MLELWYFTWIFLVIRPFGGYHYFLPCDLDLGFWPIFWNFNLTNNFWTVSARAMIVHISIPCDKTFPWVPFFFTMWPWPWSLTIFENFKLANNFWTVSARALIFNMSISSDNICVCDFGHYLDHLCFTNTSCFLFTLYNTDLSVIVKLEQALLWNDTWIWKPFVDNLLNERKSIDY